nr:bioactive peptide P2=putative esophageal neuroregulator [Perinereis vancaurica, Peptide, 6 aa] [Perinereis vancaurica]
ATWLDT